MESQLQIQKGDKKLIRIAFDKEKSLSELHEELKQRGVIRIDDIFLDDDGYPIAKKDEGSTIVSTIIKKDQSVVKIKTQTSSYAGLFDNKPPPIPKFPDTPKHDMKPPTPSTTDDHTADLNKLIATVSAIPDVVDPFALTQAEWDYLIDKNQLLSGIDVDRKEPRRTFKSACRLKTDKPDFMYWDASEVEAILTYTQQSTSYVHSKFEKTSATVSYAFASASVEHSKTERVAKQETKKNLYITGQWNFPRVILNMDSANVELLPEIVDAVNAALDEQHDEQDQYRLLSEVFKEYGHVWPSEVVLGGQLYLTHSKTVETTVDEQQEEETVRAAVAASIGKLSGGASHTSGSATDARQEEVKEVQKNLFTATGGNTLLAQEPGKWVATVAPFRNWSVIKLSGARPLYHLLDSDLRERIDKLRSNIEPSRVLGLNPGDVITLKCAVDFEAVNAGKYGKDAAELTYLANNGNIDFEYIKLNNKPLSPPLVGASATAAATAQRFIVEFPLDGHDDLIALRAMNSAPNPPYFGIQESATVNKIFQSIPGFPLPFLMPYNKLTPDQYSMFEVEVVDPAKRQVRLRPFATKTLSNKQIPRYVKAVHCKQRKWIFGTFNDVVLLAPAVDEPDPFCLFEISIETIKSVKLTGSKKERAL